LAHIQPGNLQNVQKMCFWQKALGVSGLRLVAYKVQHFNMKWLRVLNLSPVWISDVSCVNLLVSLYTPKGEERHCDSKCFVQKHDTITAAVFKPESLDLESNVLTIQWEAWPPS